MNENRRTSLQLDFAAVTALVVSWVTRETAYTGPNTCTLRRLFHLPCGGCGLTRSWASLWRGEVNDAFRENWFGPPLFVVCAFFPLADSVRIFLGKEPLAARLLDPATVRRLTVLVLVVWVGAWTDFSFDPPFVGWATVLGLLFALALATP